MKYAGLVSFLGLLLLVAGLSFFPQSAPPPEKQDPPEPLLPRCHALIAFETPTLRTLQPGGTEPVVLSWHSVTKGECGACVVIASTFFSNADGSVTRRVDWGEGNPPLPHLSRGRSDGGEIRLDSEGGMARAIWTVSELPGSPGVDRFCVVITVVCTKEGRVTAQDADVSAFLLPR